MKKKNIIVIMTDEQRADALSCNKNSYVQTPNIDAIASEGFNLKETFCVSPLCVPSRNCFFTSQYPQRNASFGNGYESHISLDQLSLVELLKNEGYKIGLSGKNHTFQDDYFDTWFDYREQYFHWGKEVGTLTESDKSVIDWIAENRRHEGLIDGAMPFPEEQCPTYRIAEDAIKFVDQCNDDPFFLYYSFPDPHWPNIVPEPYYSMIDPEQLELEASDINWSDKPFKYFVQSNTADFCDYTIEERKRILATYYAQIAFIDKAVGMLTDHLKKEGLYEDTVILFCADHGNFAGRYNLIGKTGGFMDALIRIPAVLRLPGLEGGKEIDAQINNIDFTPTFLEYLGMKQPGCMQGESFLDVLKGERDQHRDTIFCEVNPLPMPPEPVPREGYVDYHKKMDKEHPRGRSWMCDYTCNGRSACIRKNGWKYSWHTGWNDELYNLEEDPMEKTNLAQNSDYTAIKSELQGELIQWAIYAPHVSNPPPVRKIVEA